MRFPETLKKLTFVSLFLLSLVAVPMVHAQVEAKSWSKITDEEDCDVWWRGWGKCVVMAAKEALPDIDIRRAIVDSMDTMASEALLMTMTGLSADQATACYVCAEDINTGVNAIPEVECSEDLSELYHDMTEIDPDVCDAFQLNPMATAAGIRDPMAIRGRASGSLAGITAIMYDTTLNEPVPVNLAYYSRHVAGKVPILKNTAFAQDLSIETERFPGVDLILDLWELTRNIAFGLMAVFMIIIGFMIMMRKQLNPRTAVTVQNALPRVIISLVLIAFSYAIGALMIALILPLTSVALEPLRMAAKKLGDSGTYGSEGLGILATFMTITLGAGGNIKATLITTLIFVPIMIFLLIAMIITILKAVIAYIKLLVLIVVAPLQFAWGAIPGNEDAIVRWFKSAAVNVLVIPAVVGGISIGLYFAWTYIAEASGGGESSMTSAPGTEWAQTTVSLAGVPFAAFIITIIVGGIFMMASKFPKKIEDALLNPKKK